MRVLLLLLLPSPRGDVIMSSPCLCVYAVRPHSMLFWSLTCLLPEARLAPIQARLAPRQARLAPNGEDRQIDRQADFLRPLLAWL